MSKPPSAVFFRVEGAIVSPGAMSLAAYFAANGSGFRSRFLKLGQVALTAPLYQVLGQSDRVMANRLAYLPLRNMSQDRIEELADEYFEDVLAERILEGGLELIRKARRESQRVVLISDNISQVIDPLVKRLRHVDDHICNRLEFRGGKATGKLLPPIVGGHDSGRWAESYAAEHGLDLSLSKAFAAHGPDLLLMTKVGEPCAVNPDFTLRRAARDADWPVMDYHV